MSFADEQRVLQIISDVLDVPVQSLTPQTTPAQVERWDSVQHLNLVLALEQAMGLQFNPEEIEGMQSVGAIVEIVGRKVSARG
jgi:acyl carrier protein